MVIMTLNAPSQRPISERGGCGFTRIWRMHRLMLSKGACHPVVERAN